MSMQLTSTSNSNANPAVLDQLSQPDISRPRTPFPELSVFPFSPTEDTERERQANFGPVPNIQRNSRSFSFAASEHSPRLQSRQIEFEVDIETAPVLVVDEKKTPSSPAAAAFAPSASKIAEISAKASKYLAEANEFLGKAQEKLDMLHELNIKGELTEKLSAFISETRDVISQINTLQGKIADKDVLGIVNEFEKLETEVNQAKDAGAKLIASAEEAIKKTVSCFKRLFSSCFK